MQYKWERTTGAETLGISPDPEEGIEVMQYIGLKDSKGVEIYEGDIVELDVEIHEVPKALNRHVVVFRNGAFVCSESGFYFWDYGMDSDEGLSDDTVEVIGNIYENPDLIPT